MRSASSQGQWEVRGNRSRNSYGLSSHVEPFTGHRSLDQLEMFVRLTSPIPEELCRKVGKPVRLRARGRSDG